MKYLYIFGFESPDEIKSNDEHGTDFESSCAFFIEAESEEDALAWGHKVSERLVANLYDKGSKLGAEYSWRAANFANWIEPKPLSQFSGMALETLEIIKIGEFPDIDLSKY